MRKLHLSLLKEQKERNIYFSSTLSKYRFETAEDKRHEISIKDWETDYKKAEETERRLKDDSFFNGYKNYNIIRS